MTDGTTPLLRYATSTDPAPVAISTRQLDADARVNISVSPDGGDPVYANQIVVAVPVGNDAPSLFRGAPNGSVSTGRWAITTQFAKGAELWADAPADQDYEILTYDCVSPNDFRIDYNLVLGVLGVVAEAVGPATVQIQETSGTTADPGSFTQKSASVGVDKAWPQFFLSNFSSADPAAPTGHATDFHGGAPILFRWESNGTWFEVFTSARTEPVYAGTLPTFTLTDGIERDTTFVLVASMTGSPGQDSPQGGYETIVRYDALTITVSDPVLTPASAAVAGTLSVGGPTTLGPTSTGALTAASASVPGGLTTSDVTANGKLLVGGATTLGATAAGSLSVSGQSLLADATVNGQLSAKGASFLADVNVAGTLTATANPVAMLGTGKLLASATAMGQAIPMTGVSAKTDGFAVAFVTTPGNNSKSSWGYGQINTIGTWFQVLGGTVGSFGGGWSSQMDANPNAICIPIPKGSYWYYAGYNWDGGQMPAPIFIYWFPMGGPPTALEDTYEIVSAEEMARVGAPAPPPRLDVGAVLAAREDAAASFLTRLERALGRQFGADAKSELSELLLRL